MLFQYLKFLSYGLRSYHFSSDPYELFYKSAYHTIKVYYKSILQNKRWQDLLAFLDEIWNTSSILPSLKPLDIASFLTHNSIKWNYKLNLVVSRK